MDIGKDLQTAYNDGYKKGALDFAERIKTYYRYLSGKTLPALVEYHVDQIVKEMLEVVEQREGVEETEDES